MSEPSSVATGGETDGGRRDEARRAYEAPRAEFVPLHIEERLMLCGKTNAMSSCTSPVYVGVAS